MSQVELTPALLAELRENGKKLSWFPTKSRIEIDDAWFQTYRTVHPDGGGYLLRSLNSSTAEFYSVATPAVVLAMIERIRRLEAAQCWVIVDEAGNTVNGPWFTEAEAIEDLNIYEHEPGHFDKFMTYRVARWKGGAE